MTPVHAALWERILNFDIDGEPRALSFAARLARENGWTRAYADRVVVEYKRFVFLAVTGTAPVTPSDQVDQAWHLHLTYSRSYWDRLCGEILDRPLHHEPTKGGPDEAAKFDQQYNATLARYQAVFGSAPPSAIWPPAAVRFGEDLHFARVNLVRHYVLPERQVRRRVSIAALFAVALLPLGILAILGGGQFAWHPEPWANALVAGGLLGFVLVFLAVELWLVRRVRAFYTEPDGPCEDVPPLGAYDLAYLADGPTRVAQAAAARLVEAGVLNYDAKARRLTRAGSRAPERSHRTRTRPKSLCSTKRRPTHRTGCTRPTPCGKRPRRWPLHLRT